MLTLHFLVKKIIIIKKAFHLLLLQNLPPSQNSATPVTTYVVTEVPNHLMSSPLQYPSGTLRPEPPASLQSSPWQMETTSAAKLLPHPNLVAIHLPWLSHYMLPLSPAPLYNTQLTRDHLPLLPAKPLYFKKLRVQGKENWKRKRGHHSRKCLLKERI